MRQDRPVILTGDFNARLWMWGDTIDNRRGRLLAETVAQAGLLCMNNGMVLTYERVVGQFGN